MKTRLLVLAILTMFLTAAAGAQAAAWPPTTLAFQWQSDPNVYTILSVKQIASVKTANRTMKFYQLTGASFDITNPLLQFPIGGYGYLNVTMFIFSLSGTVALGGVPNGFYNLEGYLAPNQSGQVYARGSFDAAWGISAGPIGITGVPAKTLNVPLLP